MRRSILAALLAPLSLCAAVAVVHAHEPDDTRTPIKHVIVIIGENRTFDHVFATYQPVAGQSVDNLLSKGIIIADGTPGPNYAQAVQSSASDQAPQRYQLNPGGKAPYATLPPPLAGGPTSAYLAAGTPERLLASYENGLPIDYLVYLTTGGTGLAAGAIDTRIAHAVALPPGPFPLTSQALAYDSYTASPAHRFYQMWQQLDCNAGQASFQNPSGCKADLFAWVEVTVGAGSNGLAQQADFNAASTKEGATAMGFFNVQKGDAPYLTLLADHYAMSDNYHQPVMGGTGANHVALGTGDAIWFSDGKGNPAVPPHHQLVAQGSANAGVVDEIENPDPAPGTNNWYTQDGYGGGSSGSPSFGGGSYSNCSDRAAPGVAAVLQYLESLTRPVKPNCEAGHYYLLNNYNPGYFGDGSNAYSDRNDKNTVFTIAPSSLRNIGDALGEKGISYAYFGDQFNLYRKDPYQRLAGDKYCNICNFLQYSTSIMTSAKARGEHLKDTADLYAEIAKGRLPAVSFVKPSGIVDGHPATSKLNLFEGFVKKLIDAVQAHPSLWKETAIFVTFDEGGGYYDSGYVQPLDFFGDGTRVPLIVVSPNTQPGHISHDYADHVSILKFIERNWDLAPLTNRSRDNLPNPAYGPHNPYVPVNGPAIGDLFDLFFFGS